MHCCLSVPSSEQQQNYFVDEAAPAILNSMCRYQMAEVQLFSSDMLRACYSPLDGSKSHSLFRTNIEQNLLANAFSPSVFLNACGILKKLLLADLAELSLTLLSSACHQMSLLVLSHAMQFLKLFFYKNKSPKALRYLFNNAFY